VSELVKQFILLSDAERHEAWEDFVLQRPVEADYTSYNEYLDDLSAWEKNVREVEEAMTQTEEILWIKISNSIKNTSPRDKTTLLSG
jgi:hypothetical protein